MLSIKDLIMKAGDDSDLFGNAVLLGRKCRTYLVVWAFYEKTFCSVDLLLICSVLFAV